MNVGLASRGDLVPLPRGWEDRSLLAESGQRLAFYHFDPYAQALSKVERDHARDREDVKALIASGLVEPQRLLAYFDEIEPSLYAFRRSTRRRFGRESKQPSAVACPLFGPDFFSIVRPRSAE